MFTVSDWFRAAKEQQEQLEAQLREVRQRRERLRVDREALNRRLLAASADLGSLLLPSLTPEHLDQAVRWTGYRRLQDESPIAAREAERQKIEQTLREIAHDPEYLARSELCDPVVGSLPLAIAELEQARAPLADILRRAEHPRLERLLEVGYGTAAYDVPWWRLSFYDDWKAGDEVLEAFPEQKTFAEVRSHILHVREALQATDEKLAALRTRKERVQGMAQEHAQLTEELPRLNGKHLAAARRGLVEYLKEVPTEMLGPRVAGVPDLELALKRFYGLLAQQRYLAELEKTQLDGFEQRVQEQLQKLRRDRSKLSRPKHQFATFPVEAFERRFQDRSTKYAKHWERYDQTVHPLVTFDRYDRGSLLEDFLWWDLFTDGRIDGDFIPEVSAFRQAHPGRRYERGTEELEADAAAAVASSRDVADTFHDAS